MSEEWTFSPDELVIIETVNNKTYRGKIRNIENGFIVIRLTENSGNFRADQFIRINISLIEAFAFD